VLAAPGSELLEIAGVDGAKGAAAQAAVGAAVRAKVASTAAIRVFSFNLVTLSYGVGAVKVRLAVEVPLFTVNVEASCT
jgi:hypothetical protein